MELKSINIEVMLKKQKQCIMDYDEMEEEIVNKDVEILTPEKPKCSHTNVVAINDVIYLTRYINNTIVKVVFTSDVMVKDVIGYFDIDDTMFTKLCVRKMPTTKM